MGWGDIFSSATEFISDGGGDLISTGLNFFNASEANDRFEDMASTNSAVQDQTLALANQYAAYDAQMQNRLLARTDELDTTLRNVFSQIGAPQVIDQASIQNDSNVLYNQYMGDINNSIDRVNSQGYADLMSKGIDASTLNGDRQRDLVEKYAQSSMEARNLAQSEAVNRATANESLTNTNRGNVLGEYSYVLQTPATQDINAWKGVGLGGQLTTSAAGNSQQNVSMYNDNATNAGNAFGNSLDDFFGSNWFNKDKNTTNTNQGAS